MRVVLLEDVRRDSCALRLALTRVNAQLVALSDEEAAAGRDTELAILSRDLIDERIDGRIRGVSVGAIQSAQL